MATNFHRRHGTPGGYVPSESGISEKDVIQHLFGLGNQGESEAFRRAQAADWVEQQLEVVASGKSLPNDAGERWPAPGADRKMADAVVAYLKLTDEELEAAHVRLLAKYPTLA